jgi:integrin beta 3
VSGRIAGAASAAVPPVRDEGVTGVARASVPGATARPPAVADPVPDAGGDRDDSDQAGGLRGARSQLRQQLRAKRRLRVLTLVALSVVVLGLLPLLFGIRSVSRDPVFHSLDALDVPSWAANDVDDRSSGSRWCFLECRFRERTAQSQRPFEETANAYAAALKGAGWQPWQVAACPEQPVTDGRYSCWRRDEFTLDLWVRLPQCAVDAVAAQNPAAVPSSGVVPTTDPEKCVGSTVSIKVQNAVTDPRGKPAAPGPVGETPDPVLSNDPLLEPTPSPS